MSKSPGHLSTAWNHFVVFFLSLLLCMRFAHHSLVVHEILEVPSTNNILWCMWCPTIGSISSLPLVHSGYFYTKGLFKSTTSPLLLRSAPYTARRYCAGISCRSATGNCE